MDLKANYIKLNNICRICLQSNNNLISLFDNTNNKNNISDMLNFCEFWNVLENDGFPQNICEECADLVFQSYKLKQLCLSSKSSLEHINKDHSLDDIFITECFKQESVSAENISKNELYVTENDEIGIPDKESVSANITDESCNTLFPINSDNQIGQLNNGSKDKSYSCEKCQEGFKFEKDALVHQSVHSLNLICNSCNKPFITTKKLKRHIKTHMISKSHICEFCNKGFCESAALLKHIRQNHMGIPRDKKYSCKDCGKKFTDKYYLSLHVRKHTGEKPLMCNICDKSFYDPRSLKVHILVHKGDRSYLCSHCGKAFVQSSHLKKHLVVHTNEKSFVCNMCNKKFTQSSSLQRHKKKHSKIHVTSVTT